MRLLLVPYIPVLPSNKCSLHSGDSATVERKRLIPSQTVLRTICPHHTCLYRQHDRGSASYDLLLLSLFRAMLDRPNRSRASVGNILGHLLQHLGVVNVYSGHHGHRKGHCDFFSLFRSWSHFKGRRVFTENRRKISRIEQK